MCPSLSLYSFSEHHSDVRWLSHVPLRTNALQRTTTLTLPGSSSIGGGAIIVRGSLALSETAEAVDRLPYMRRSMVFSNNQKRCSLVSCTLMMLKRCIDATVWSGARGGRLLNQARGQHSLPGKARLRHAMPHTISRKIWVRARCNRRTHRTTQQETTCSSVIALGIKKEIVPGWHAEWLPIFSRSNGC